MDSNKSVDIFKHNYLCIYTYKENNMFVQKQSKYQSIDEAIKSIVDLNEDFVSVQILKQMQKIEL